jgi:alpha-methylacyl-CoA racemase
VKGWLRSPKSAFRPLWTGELGIMSGTLQGLRIIEFAGLGPVPFCGMMLADHGAEVIRIDRPGGGVLPEVPANALSRSRKSVVLDLKSPEGRTAARALCKGADGLIEGFRPGVMERLGLGPDELIADTPGLVYGRMTGWGQTGPLADAVGHDINYIAVSGVLHTVGQGGGKPVPPVNYVGDIAGGAMMLAFGMVSGILNVRAGGAGQVVDAAMTDGSAIVAAIQWTLRALGAWRDARGDNELDGGAPYYDTYACADGKYVAVGAIEPQFYAALGEVTGLRDDPAFDDYRKRRRWPELRRRLTEIFAIRNRDEWCSHPAAHDACLSPVLSLEEAPAHPHNLSRNTFIQVGGAIQPAPAPRFLGTPAATPAAAPALGAHGIEILSALGYSLQNIHRVGGGTSSATPTGETARRDARQAEGGNS